VSTKVLEYEQGRANNVTEDSSKGKVLIIDASSLSYDPGLFPKVVSKGGKQISNPNEPLRVFTDLKKAQTAAGSETLLIKADSVNDKNELIVNDEDAQKLLVNSGDLIIVR
jgi:anaerobic selenocysteine-containing dehydrogenase